MLIINENEPSKGVIIKFILTRNLSNVQFAPIDVVVVMLSMVTCVSIQVCTIHPYPHSPSSFARSPWIVLFCPPKPIINEAWQILTVKNHVNIHEWSWNIMNINIWHAFLQFQWFFFREEFFSGGPKLSDFLFSKLTIFSPVECQVPSLKIHQNREKISSPFSPILYRFIILTISLYFTFFFWNFNKNNQNFYIHGKFKISVNYLELKYRKY